MICLIKIKEMINMNRRAILVTTAALSVSAPAIIGRVSAQNINITGAGATFPAPLYHSWARRAQSEIGVTVNYQSIGSGGGINQIRARTVNFGATDAPLADPGDLYQFPTVEGRVVPIYNIPGIDNLNLTMPLIVKIYQGQITFWNDPQIVLINPGINIPRMRIVPIYRADGSGTTFIWTSAMRDSNSGWTDAGTSVSWPTGQGARGNEGVSGMVRVVRGAIGYVEYIYSRVNNITFANSPFTNNLSSHPVGKTYILIPRQPNDRIAHGGAVRFFEWCLTHGLETARSLHYHTFNESEYTKIITDLKSL
jgi:phosphate transport system substrate-binding protein